MRQDEIIQTIVIYLDQKGINTDELLIRRLELLDKFNSIRAKVLSDFIIKEYEISSRNYQTTYCDKITYNDDGTLTYNYFTKYPTIMGRTAFVGNTTGTCRYREYLTISEYQSTIRKRVPKITGYYPEEDKLKIDNVSVSTIRQNAIYSNPSDLPTFNPEFDEYPIDDALIPVICDGMFQVYFSKISGVKPDITNDSSPTA